MTEPIAVIEVGSSAIRMVVAEVGPKFAIRTLENLQKPVSFGKDVFTSGRLSHASIRQGIDILDNFAAVLESYGVKRVQAIATSAVRESTNKDNFIDQIFVRTGIDVEVIEGAEENRLELIAVETALAGRFDFEKKNCLIIEVGTGATEIILTTRGQVALTRTLLIGPLRLPDQASAGKIDSTALQRLLKRRIHAFAEEFNREYNLSEINAFIAMGASMRFVCRQMREQNDEMLLTLSPKDFRESLRTLSKMPAEEISDKYALPYSDAESLYASLLIYDNFLAETKTDSILVPMVSIRDGLLSELAQLVSGYKRTDLSRQVIHSARNLAKKYRADETHASAVAHMALKLFDGLAEDHGLGTRERLLLEVSAILHDIGNFISPSSHHKHGFYLISAADLFGLRKVDKDMVANIVRYHRRSAPKPTHIPYISLPKPERAVVSKLSALLRVAEALDASHQQKCRDFTLERNGDEITLWVPETVGDISLERQSLIRKNDMLTDVLGLVIQIKQGAPGGAAGRQTGLGMDKFFDRELSALEFNARVLAEGMDPTNPLFERLKFVGIVSSNMDEFFMVRIASLKASDTDYAAVRDTAHALLEKRNEYFLKTMVPELAAAGFVRPGKPESCNPAQLEFLGQFFHREILPVLTPVALSEDRPLPDIANLRPHFVAGLVDPKHRGETKYAVVDIPAKLFPRMIFLPTGDTHRTASGGGWHPFVLIEDLIASYAAELFPGFEIVEKGLMRITRGAELTFDEEKDEDFLRVMTEALRERREGDIVRMEVSAEEPWAGFLKKKLSIAAEDVVVNPSWIDLKTISQLAFQPGFESLKRPGWEPRAVPDFERTDDVWKLLKEKSVLVFHPYQSFDTVVRFLESAAEDRDVLAIKQTLYRTDQDSPVIRALERAAANGKRVTALVELKARFDEENNMAGARRLANAGASVLYGVAGLKTHAKVCLVVRREPEGIKRYIHMATGNYNSKTSRIYSDIGYFTTDEDIANDVSAFFNMITGYSQPLTWAKIEVAPYGLRKRLLRMIRREALRATPEHPGHIRAKMNSLADPDLIEALYQASNAGVKIELNVRGICRLRPGVPRLSENIRVVSIVDQFLEHSRIFAFANGGEEEVYLSSADWMPRNLDRRLELLFPIQEPHHRRELLDVLDIYFRDNTKAWALQPDGSYQRVEAGKSKRLRAQEALCERAKSAEESFLKATPKELKPQKPRPVSEGRS